MSLSEGFVAHLKDLLEELGHITVRRMFGGAGVYCDGTVFAFLDEDVMYLKTDEAGRAAFKAEGLQPFTYETKNGVGQITSYYRAPERLFDDPDDMREWVLRAIAVSKRLAAAKTKKPAARKAAAKAKRPPAKRKRP